MILTIRDCSLAFRAFYSPPRAFERSRLNGFASRLLEQFGLNTLQPKDLVLDSGDQLYRYALRATLYNGLMIFSLSAQTADANFNRLVRRADRTLAVNCLHTMIEACNDGLSDECYAEAGVNAAFASPEERRKFFSQRVTNGIDSAGILAYKQVGGPNQLVRLEIDQSWAYPDAAYLVWKTIGMRLNEAMELKTDQVWTSVFDLMRPFDLEFVDE